MKDRLCLVHRNAIKKHFSSGGGGVRGAHMLASESKELTTKGHEKMTAPIEITHYYRTGREGLGDYTAHVDVHPTLNTMHTCIYNHF